MHSSSASHALRTSLVALAASLVAIGCGDDDASSSAPSGASEAGADAGVETGTEASADAVSEADDSGQLPDGSAEDATEADAPEPDAPEPDAPGPDGSPEEPTPGDIQFEPVNPVPSGESLLFNDWDAWPNTVSAVTIDGSTTTELFRVYRVWSMGVSRANDRIAFSCGDPEQEQHWGIAIGDAIQHTWVYDVATETVQLVAFGNINDECHAFGPGDQWLYVCRRYDFTTGGEFKGWRIGRIRAADRDFEFLTDEVAQTFALSPQPTIDESQLYYGLIEIAGSPPKQTHAILRKPLPSGAPETVRADANRPVLSPDGTRYLYSDHQDGRNLWSSKLDGTDAFRVVSEEATEPVWSPDGQRVAYLLRDDANNCDHIKIAAADGSEADSPTVVRDCSQTGEFITELDWIVRP